MHKYFKWLFACCGILICVNTNSFSQTNEGIVNAVNKQLIPLKTLDPDADYSDLQPLKKILSDKSIIGIGEATHGTKEFFVFKHRMLEFLVKEMGFKTFVIEDDFGGMQTINDYVLNGKGDIDNCIKNLGFGIWMTQEVKNMIVWIKEYNDTQIASNKVQFFGCDMQWGTTAMGLLKDHLTETNQYTPRMEEGFMAIKKALNPTVKLTSKDKKAIENTIGSLNTAQFSISDTGKISMFKHNIRVIQQFFELVNSKSKLFPAKSLDVRDKYMAENCEWIYNFTGQKKMMIWAHNGHINKLRTNYRLRPMGMVLSENFKDKYYSMGFDFSAGKIRSFDIAERKYVAMDAPALMPNSSGAIFAECAERNFILDFKSASKDPVINTFLNKEISSVFTGGGYTVGSARYYVTNKLADTYDAIIFIRNTNAATDIY